VKTYSYKLNMVEEQLTDQAGLRAELAQRIAQKRSQLLARMREVAPAAR
jgi:hypothetical protein